jgi:hypothetical protein
MPGKFARAKGNLAFRFLNPVFSKEPESEIRGGADSFRCLAFGHREELNGIGRPACALASSLDPGPDSF